MPGETFNSDNTLGMGKIWFTVNVAPWDPHECVAFSAAARAICLCYGMCHGPLPHLRTPLPTAA